MHGLGCVGHESVVVGGCVVGVAVGVSVVGGCVVGGWVVGGCVVTVVTVVTVVADVVVGVPDVDGPAGVVSATSQYCPVQFRSHRHVKLPVIPVVGDVSRHCPFMHGFGLHGPHSQRLPV